MKKLYFLTFLLMISQGLLAQRAFQETKVRNSPAHLVATAPAAAREILAVDTLVPGSLADSICRNLVVYTNPDGGYIAGGNVYGDLEVMQKYSIAGQLAVTEVLVLFGAKKQANPNSNLYAKVYSVGPNGGPGQELGVSQPVTIGSIDTINIEETSFTFATPIAVTDSFFVGFVNPTTAGDTVGAFSTRDSCYTGQSLAWIKLKDSSFVAFEDTLGWDLRIDLMIFPVVSDAVTSANSPEVLRTLKLFHAYPNPAQDLTTIRYELKERSTIDIDVFDITGKKLLHVPVGMQPPGTYKNEIDISALKTGLYIYRVTTDKGFLTGRLNISR